MSKRVNEKTKSRLQGLLRWGVAGILLFWLFKSGKLSGLKDLERLLASPWLFTLAFFATSMNFVFNFFRWKLLLSGVHVKIPFRRIVRLSMIGQFFSIFMPGSVGGDVIKAVYVARAFPSHKTDAVASILLDRILGFLTLMAFASFFFVLSFDPAHLPKSLQGFSTILAIGTVALFMIVLLPSSLVRFLEKSKSQNALVQRITKTLKAFARSPITILKGLGISFLSQGSGMLGMYFIGLAVYGSLPWGNLDVMRFISASAVGTTASALPLSPMGLGVGQLAFGKAFKLLGAPEEAYGIVIISAIQIISFVLNLSGALWFLKSKKEIQQVMS